jgi:transcription elongation factor Elf1
MSNSEAVIDWRRRKKIELVEYKGGKCEVCGYNKSVNALQFHHKNPNDKDFTVSGKSLSFEKLKKEVDKCILVCANCHAEIHEELTQL